MLFAEAKMLERARQFEQAVDGWRYRTELDPPPVVLLQLQQSAKTTRVDELHLTEIEHDVIDRRV
jgi:hypothetical protein